MKILGISAFYHDSAIALLEGEHILFASQEERFSRIKHDSDFPKQSLSYVAKNFLENNFKNLDYIVFFDKPFLKFERLIETYLYYSPFKGYESFEKSIPIWIKEKLFQKDFIIKEISKIFNVNQSEVKKKLHFSEHHLSHAASAFFPSNFNSSAIITLDGVGEWATSTIGLGKENNISIINEINFPHSLGLIYSAFTYFLGFKVNSGEYKLMGLAPFGKPRFKNKIYENLIDVKEDGSYFLNQEFFNYSVGLTMTNSKFNDLFGIKKREPNDEIEQVHMDLASSIQEVLDEIIIKIARYTKELTGEKNLCLAGGVALNCVSNSKIIKEKIFENIWVQPASGDAGGSLGAALYFYYDVLGNPRNFINKNKKKRDTGEFMRGSFLGADYNDNQIKLFIDKYNIKYDRYSEKDLIKVVAKKINEGNSIGWFSGKSEFGPRALGARSILADPRPKTMQKNLNLKIKFRESFRPFAPTVLEEEHENWFSSEVKNEFMLFINKVLNSSRDNNLDGFDQMDKIQSPINSVTHVDLTARVQSINSKYNPRFYYLIKEFFDLTGVPILINTSFNVRGEPIVNNPEDAIKCFFGTNLDLLVLENYVIDKLEQKDNLFTYKYSTNFQKD
jgi:carbamoyltransferase